MNPNDANPPPAPSVFRKWGPRVAGAFAALLVGIQFVPVDAKENPPSQPPLAEPPEVVAILKRACYDCHSHEVKWPWYSRIAPASWLVARDVIKGRDAVNFSDWPEDEEDRAFNREQCWDSVESGDMPLWFYLPLHPEANLTEADKAILKKWSETEVEEEDEEEEDEDSKPEASKGEPAKPAGSGSPAHDDDKDEE
jgi:Haem-binding domain